MDEIPDHRGIPDGCGNSHSNEKEWMDMAEGHMDGPAKNQYMATDRTRNQAISHDMGSKRH